MPDAINLEWKYPVLVDHGGHTGEWIEYHIDTDNGNSEGEEEEYEEEDE